MFENFGMGELLVVLLVVMIFFGPKKLPELMQSLGKGIRQFKQAQQDFQTNMSKMVEDEPKKVSPPEEKKTDSAPVNETHHEPPLG